MKKKINVYMMLLAGLAIMITLVLLTLVYYGNFRQQVIYDLRTTCHLLSDVALLAEGVALHNWKSGGRMRSTQGRN